MPFVYDFDHSHRRPPMELKDLLGGKGANLAEMTSVLRLPVPHGFTISTDACRAYMDGGWPDGLDAEVERARRRLERKMGKRPRRPDRPAARERALGGEILHAGDDGHRPQPRPQRRVGAGPGQADRATSASPTTRIAASCRCTAASCSASPARSSTASSTRPRSGRAPPPTPRCRRRAAGLARRGLQGDRQRPHRPADFPQDPDDQLRGAIEAVFGSWNGPARHRLSRPRAHRPRPRHGRQRPGHGVRQPRRRSQGRASASPGTRPPAPRARTATSS